MLGLYSLVTCHIYLFYQGHIYLFYQGHILRFTLRTVSCSRWSLVSLALLGESIRPALENNLSKYTEPGGTLKYFVAILASSGHKIFFSCQYSKGSEPFPLNGISSSAQYRFKATSIELAQLHVPLPRAEAKCFNFFLSFFPKLLPLLLPLVEFQLPHQSLHAVMDIAPLAHFHQEVSELHL